MKIRIAAVLLAAGLAACSMTASAQMLDQTPTRVQTSLKPDLELVGTLTPKSVAELGTSMWTLGCETLDRDLADWDAYRGYLRPLGIRHIRLQGGWARTEKEKGVYDFAWLDHVVDDAHALGLTVCLETSYGNKLYQKNAGLGPGGEMPAGDETLAAWDRWVEAMVRHYSPKGVKSWMMYNEPNLRKGRSAEFIADFNIRTAEIIKRVDPQAQVAGLVAAGANVDLAAGFLDRLNERGKAQLFDWLIYHAYGANPDSIYPGVEKLKQLLQEKTPHIRLWQGEAGCASEAVQYALKGVDWTELSHAKWNARRMLGDLGHDVRSAVFTISDLSYNKDFISRYGLLKTNPDNSIIKVKTAYYVVQNVVSMFNDSVQRIPDYRMEVESDKPLTWHAYRDRESGLDVIAFWNGGSVPTNHTCEVDKAQLTVAEGRFDDPVWVDLLTGNVYAIPAERINVDGATYAFKEIPVYDAPCVLTDKSLLSLVPARKNK